MVEGPGCTRNGRKAAGMVGKSVVGVAGVAAKKTAPSIRGRTLVDVLTLGKQLWLFFGGLDRSEERKEAAIRCHFGMNGSLHLGEHPYSRTLTLLIRFGDGTELRLYDGSAVVADAHSARESVQNGVSRDVCSPCFNIQAALDAVSAAPPGQMVADTLLDQLVLPGVGNIIKNESLHRVALHPRTLMRSLTRDQLSRLLREVRNFSDAWCRSGRQPPCHIYNQATCKDCAGVVSLCKLGDVGAPRPTFWCEACIGRGIRGLDQWLSSGKIYSGPAVAHVEGRPIKRIRPEAATAPIMARTTGISPAISTTKLSIPTLVSASVSTAVSSTSGQPSSGYRITAAGTESSGLRPCREHGGGQITLRRVRKAGLNAARLFFGCRGKACEHFAWADVAFPHCACASAPVAGLRISKQQGTGGRWFFGCRSDARARCQYFKWADPDVARLVGGLLTPLT